MSSDEEEIAPRRKRSARVIVDEEEETEQTSAAEWSSEEGNGDEDEDGSGSSSSSEESSSSSEEADSVAEDDGGNESEWEEIPQELLLEGCQQRRQQITVVSAHKNLPGKAADAAGEASDSDLSDAQAERCAVCLNRFLGQEVGTPESCDHVFCLDCIQEWAKNMNTCPVDRSVFRLILVRKGDRVVHQIPVPALGEEQEDREEEEDLTYCEVCGRCDREDRLLLCDACDLGYHCECLSPPLDSVPIEEWYCPDCAPDHAPAAEEPLTEELMEEFREMLASRFRPGQSGGLRRAIARTRASETVRIRIQRRRAAVQEETVDSPKPRVESLSASSRRTSVRRSAPKRRRKASSRKTASGRKRLRRKTKGKGGSTKRRKTTSSRSHKTHRKGSKRKSSRRTTRRSRLSSRPLACPLSVRQRIVDRLGLARPPPGQSLPLMRRVDLASSSSAYARGSPAVGSTHGPSFSIFGDRDELVSLDGSCGEDSGSELMVARPRLPQQSVARVKKAIASPASSSLNRVRAALAKVSPPPACGDLLGSILEMQSVFHSKGGLAGAVVQRDGSLDLRAVPSSVRQCPRSPPGSPAAESPASPPSSGRGSHATTTVPARRASGAGGYTAPDCVGSSGDNSAPSRQNDDHAHEGCGSYHHVMVPSPDAYIRKNGRERARNGPVEEDDDIDIYSDIDDCDDSGDGGGANHNGDDLEPSVNGESPVRFVAAPISRDDVPRHVRSGAVDHEEEGASSSENELVIDEQENVGEAPEDEEEVDEQSRAAEESEEEEPIHETDNVRSPSPDNDRDVSQASDDEGGLEIVENGNSSCDEQGEDENCGAKESDEGEDDVADGEEEEADKAEGQPFTDEDGSPQQEPEEEEEASLAAVEDTPASPTEEDSSFVPDAPASPPVEDAPSSPVEEVPSSPPTDALASPSDEAVAAASPIESGEESSGPASPVRQPTEDQVAQRNGDGEDGQDSEGKAEGDDDTQDNASSPKDIESPEAEPEEEEEGEEQEESSLATGGPASEDIASPAPEETKGLDDGGAVRNLLDSIGAEDITSPEEEEEEGALKDTEDEEGLIEDVSNGMEDISEPGSTDGLVDNLEDVVREQEPWRRELAKEKPPRKERKSKHKKESCHHRKHRRHRRNNSSNEDREEGEIVEEQSPSSSSRRRKEAEALINDAVELPPRINISELPRIPKLKRGSDKMASHVTSSESVIGVKGEDTCRVAASHVEVKRTSVLGRIDSGNEISWKKLSKHSRERSYRDGKQRDETVLFKEREIKKRSKGESRIEHPENMMRKNSEARGSSHSPPPPKKKERRPDRELYVRPDKKRDWQKKEKEREKSSHKESKSSSSSLSHKNRKDKCKEKDKHTSKDHGQHSSKDRRRSSSKEHRERRHSGRHRRDHSEDRSVEKYSKQKESRRAEERESRRYDDRDIRESREKRDSREVRSSRETRESRDEGSRGRETRESRDARESRDTRESRDVRESRDLRESKDTRESREARESTRESREVARDMREPRRTEEKIKVVMDKDYWHDKTERHKGHSPSPLLEESEEHTPIESKEVIAKGDSIIINVNFNRCKKEPKTPPSSLKEPDTHRKLSARGSRSRKRVASSPITPRYGSDSGGEEGLVTKKRRRHHRLCHDSGRDESEASQADDEDEVERSPMYDFDDRASASSPSGSDSFADKPSTPPEVHQSPPSPATADKSPTSSQATPPVPEPSPPLLPQPPISSSTATVQLSPQSPPPPSPPSPPEDNSYDPCEPTKSPSPPPPMVAASEVDPCPPPEPELPPLPPEPEPPSRSSIASAASLPQTTALPSVVAPVTGPTVLPTVTGLQLQPPPPFLPARPLTTVVGSLAGAWAPAPAPVILGLRAPFVPPALGALLPPPMGLLPLRPPPPPMMRLATPTIVASPAATAPTALATLPPEPAARTVEQTGVVDMDVSTPPLYSPTDIPSTPPEPATTAGQQLAAVVQRGSSAFDTLLPSADRKAYGRSSKSKRHASSGALSRDSKQVVHFVMEKGKGSSSNVTRGRSESKFGRNMDESQLQILDELPSSAVEMLVKDKFLKKLNRQERVVEEVKLALKPYYNRREVSKEEYKDILRKSVPKICHNKKGEINPMKIKAFVEGYVRKIKHYRKKLGNEQRHKVS